VPPRGDGRDVPPRRWSPALTPLYSGERPLEFRQAIFISRWAALRLLGKRLRTSSARPTHTCPINASRLFPLKLVRAPLAAARASFVTWPRGLGAPTTTGRRIPRRRLGRRRLVVSRPDRHAPCPDVIHRRLGRDRRAGCASASADPHPRGRRRPQRPLDMEQIPQRAGGAGSAHRTSVLVGPRPASTTKARVDLLIREPSPALREPRRRRRAAASSGDGPRSAPAAARPRSPRALGRQRTPHRLPPTGRSAGPEDLYSLLKGGATCSVFPVRRAKASASPCLEGARVAALPRGGRRPAPRNNLSAANPWSPPLPARRRDLRAERRRHPPDSLGAALLAADPQRRRGARSAEGTRGSANLRTWGSVTDPRSRRSFLA